MSNFLFCFLGRAHLWRVLDVAGAGRVVLDQGDRLREGGGQSPRDGVPEAGRPGGEAGRAHRGGAAAAAVLR